MNKNIYKHIIKVQSPEAMVKVLQGIDRIYDKGVKLVIDNSHYYFEDRQGKVVTFDSEEDLINTMRSHKGVKKLYKKLLKDESDIMRDCIKLVGSLENAIQAYMDYRKGEDSDYAEEVMMRGIVGTQLFPMAHLEYNMINNDDYVIDFREFVSYNENNKVNGLFAIDYDADTIIKMLSAKSNKDNSSSNVEVGSKEWVDTYKKLVMENI